MPEENPYTGMAQAAFESQLKRQEHGSHYKDGAIQPLEFILANNLSFVIGNAIKYLFRADKKGGAEDLRKSIHYCQIELETRYGIKSKVEYNDQNNFTGNRFVVDEGVTLL